MGSILFLKRTYCWASGPLSARGLFWDFLGDMRIDGSQDHGRIRITRRDVAFRTIQLRVSGEAIFFDRLVIHFDHGNSQEVFVGERILPGGKNYVIDLLGERSVENVELSYYREPWRQNPTVSVYGSPSPSRLAHRHAPVQCSCRNGKGELWGSPLHGRRVIHAA